MTSPTATDISELVRLVRMDLSNAQQALTTAQGKLSDLILWAAAQGAREVPTRGDCPHCGPLSLNARQLAEHVYYTHDGPVPDHFALLEQRIAPDWTPDEQEAHA